MPAPLPVSPLPTSKLLGFAATALLAITAVLVLAMAAPEPAPGPGGKDAVSLTQVSRELDADNVTGAQYFQKTGELLVTREDGKPMLLDVPDGYVQTMLGDLVDADVPVTSDPGAPTRAQRNAAVLVPGAEASGPSSRWPLLTFGGAMILLVLALSARTQERVAGAASQLGGLAPVPDEVAVPSTRFADVAGADEAVADLGEMVAFLKDPGSFTRLGAKAPRGALLVGPPGTGKTLLARAVAGEAGVPFLTMSGSDFVEQFVGVGAKRVRELFAKARTHEKAIVFIDEIDAIARKRSSGDAAERGTEAENTLIALLAELDGFTARGSVLVLAATNRADTLDAALTRPGRLDRKIEVPNPDRRGRERILAVHTAGKPVAADVDLEALARRVPGFSGAQLEALVNEACLVATRAGADQVDAAAFAAAVETIAMGRARTSALVTEHDRAVTAWHEAGHTVAAFLQPDADDPVAVSIVPRGPAGGVTWMAGNDDQFLSRRKAHAQLVTALAGRAGEELLLGGEYTQGAHGDLTSATRLATAMVTQYGMSRLGFTVRENPSAPVVLEVVEELLREAHRQAGALLGAHRTLVHAVAELLLDEENVSGAQVAALAAGLGVGRAAPVVPPLPDVHTPPAVPVPAAAALPLARRGVRVPAAARVPALASRIVSRRRQSRDGAAASAR